MKQIDEREFGRLCDTVLLPKVELLLRRRTRALERRIETVALEVAALHQQVGRLQRRPGPK